MGAVKISKFLGEAPKISPELLPETCAQTASNVKLYSGDLLPYCQSSAVAAVGIGSTPETIFPLAKPGGGTSWLQWSTDVDIARNPLADAGATQRIYYTGDGEPRVTNYALATNSGTVFDTGPQAYYTLGLPTPLTAPTVAAVSFTQLSSTRKSRDAGNIATITVASTSTLKSGMYLTISGFADTTFNLTNTQITVTSATTFTYYCYGAVVADGADTAGRADLAGTNITRTYVYTWVTPWGEESGPSPTSATIYLKEGQQVNLSALPASWPGGYTGTYNTSSITLNIYRTVVSSTGTA